jgi:CheY-like chemotaxis protein
MADRKPVILVVEDEAFIQLMIAEHLRDLGYTVLEAMQLEEAIAHLEGDVPVDFVFSDVWLLEALDGVALARWIGQHKPAIPILLTSGNTHETLSQYVDEGAFLPKPYRPEEVARRIALALASREREC